MTRGNHPNSKANLSIRPSPKLLGQQRTQGIQYARDWRQRNKPRFDAIYGVESIVALSDSATAFLAANALSPVVAGSGRANACVAYRLRDGQVFYLTAYDVETTPSPRWDTPIDSVLPEQRRASK